MLIRLIFRLFNWLYKNCYFVYKPIYFHYKKISDRDKIQLLEGKIEEGMTVLDVGANIGYYTLLLSKLVGENGRVYAFEPDKLNFKHLKDNTQKLANVKIYPLAVGAKSEKLRLYSSDSMNVDHQTFDIGEGRDFVEIDAIAIDDFSDIQGQVDFVKIDIQGYDYYAFQGMLNTLKRSENVCVFGEFWPYALQKAGVDYQDYIDLLEGNNFEVTIFNFEKERIADKDYYTDFLAIKK